MRKKMVNKKGQNPGQIFMYVLTIVIVGVILVFGYQAIQDFSSRADEVTLIEFKKKMENSIGSITTEFETFKRVSFRLTTDYKEVCFLRNFEESLATPLASEFDDYPLIKDSYDSDTAKNVFLLQTNGRIGESFAIGQIRHQDDSLLRCVDVENGRIVVGMTGKGNHVVIS